MMHEKLVRTLTNKRKEKKKCEGYFSSMQFLLVSKANSQNLKWQSPFLIDAESLEAIQSD